MKRIDLSSLGWKYTEIRGKVFQSICGVKLTMVDKKSAKQLDLNRLKKFDNVRPVGSDLSSLFIPITRSLEEAELKDIFPNFTGAMMIDGEVSEFEPNIDMPKISLGPNGVREEDALGAPDCFTGKASSELPDEELLALIQRRTVPLSKLRVLHEMLDDKETFGETAMFWLFQRLRNFFNSTPLCVESAIWSFDGKSYNPPIRVVRDEHLSSFSRYKQPLFYKRGTAVEQDHGSEADTSALKLMKSSVLSREKASGDIFEMSQAPSPTSRRSLDLMNVPDSSRAGQNENRKESHGENMDENLTDTPPITSPVIEEHAFCVDEQLVPEAGKEGFIEALEQDRLPSIHNFLDGKSVMKVAFSKIAKSLTDWYDEFSKLNPYINRDIFFASARLYILERSVVPSNSKVDATPVKAEPKAQSASSQVSESSAPYETKSSKGANNEPAPNQGSPASPVPARGIKVASISKRIASPPSVRTIATSVESPRSELAPRVRSEEPVAKSARPTGQSDAKPKSSSMFARLKASSSILTEDEDDYAGVTLEASRPVNQDAGKRSVKPTARSFTPPKAVSFPK